MECSCTLFVCWRDEKACMCLYFSVILPVHMNISHGDIIKELHALADPDKAVIYKRFFKTRKGEYGEGDRFIGVTAPQVRTTARKHRDIPLNEVRLLLGNPVHEVRFVALVILVLQYARASVSGQKRIVDLYLASTTHINNWDLVDISAPHIVGHYFLTRDKALLYALARSDYLWDRRIAMLAMFASIRHNQFDDAFSIAEILLHDSHDLIHKAVGWMLREIGKRDEEVLFLFLDRHVREMPRTMLRYAIEKLPRDTRQRYLRM